MDQKILWNKSEQLGRNRRPEVTVLRLMCLHFFVHYPVRDAFVVRVLITYQRYLHVPVWIEDLAQLL